MLQRPEISCVQLDRGYMEFNFSTFYSCREQPAWYMRKKHTRNWLAPEQVDVTGTSASASSKCCLIGKTSPVKISCLIYVRCCSSTAADTIVKRFCRLICWSSYMRHQNNNTSQHVAHKQCIKQRDQTKERVKCLGKRLDFRGGFGDGIATSNITSSKERTSERYFEVSCKS